MNDEIKLRKWRECERITQKDGDVGGGHGEGIDGEWGWGITHPFELKTVGESTTAATFSLYSITCRWRRQSEEGMLTGRLVKGSALLYPETQTERLQINGIYKGRVNKIVNSSQTSTKEGSTRF